MIVSEIKLFELLKARIGEKEAEAFVEILETKVDRKFEESKDVLATKTDIGKVREDMAKMEVRLVKSVYIVGLVQYLAILASVIAIMKFLH
jgi:hypothetical protein